MSTGSNRGSKVRRDVIRMLLSQRQWRLALTVLVMPEGWALSNTSAYDLRRYEVYR